MTAKWSFLKSVFKISILIAIPAIVFGTGGRFLDKWLNTSFIFLLLGIIISMAVSFFLIKNIVRSL